MKRKYRLTRSTDIKRVRLTGKSIAHPLVVLYALPNGQDFTRFGVTAGKGVGGAVQRNRAKRLIRAALQAHSEQIQPGWDLLVVARRTMSSTTYQQTLSALEETFRRAHIAYGNHDLARTSG